MSIAARTGAEADGILGRDHPTSARCTYIRTTADTLVPPELQLTMAASIGAEIVEIGTGHGAFREQPERLAELLDATAR